VGSEPIAALYLGDPDFVAVPVAQLTDKAYAARQRRLIDSKRATPSVNIAPGKLLDGESTETTHYSVADRFGNVVSNTYTLNFSFGSNIVVPGTGLLLNNEMADFTTSPTAANGFGLVQGETNSIEPGKRPLSSMSPTIVLREGKPWLATGSPGGNGTQDSSPVVARCAANGRGLQCGYRQAAAGHGSPGKHQRSHHRLYQFHHAGKRLAGWRAAHPRGLASDRDQLDSTGISPAAGGCSPWSF